MVTSRTGTASHKRFRREVLRAGQAQGVVTCPCPRGSHHPRGTCGVTLDYDIGRQPHSAEPDHIILHARGGTDSPENGRVICRRCNQARCGQTTRATVTLASTTTNLVNW